MANEKQLNLYDGDHLSKKKAAIRRDDGISRAETHAERVTANWRDVAMTALEKYLSERGNLPFLAEEFIDWTRKQEVPQPPDARAWGSVFSAARRDEQIERIGTAAAATSNLSPKPLWRRATSGAA